MSIYEFITRVQRLQLDNLYIIKSSLSIGNRAITITFSPKNEDVVYTVNAELYANNTYISDKFDEVIKEFKKAKHEIN